MRSKLVAISNTRASDSAVESTTGSIISPSFPGTFPQTLHLVERLFYLLA